MCELEEVLLTQKELARMLAISERTLERWRSEGLGPPYVTLVRGGKVRYRLKDVADWLNKRVVQPERDTVHVEETGQLHEAWRKNRRN